LGFTINSTLSWSNHVICTIGKMCGILRQLNDTKAFLSTNLKMLIAKTKLTPLLFYGVEVFGNCDATSQHKLLVAFNNVARYIFNRRGTDRISDATFKIFDMPLKVWIEYKTLVLLHKVITTYEPKYLLSKLKFNASNRTNNLVCQKVKHAYAEKHFFICAVRSWNKLPHPLKIIKSATQFKAKLHTSSNLMFICHSFNVLY